MRPSRTRFTLKWMMVVTVLAVALAAIKYQSMWDIFRASFVLLWLAPGPVTAAWGLVVVFRRKTWLTRRPVITGKPAIGLGILAMVAGLAYAPLLIYWVIITYPKGW